MRIRAMLPELVKELFRNRSRHVNEGFVDIECFGVKLKIRDADALSSAWYGMGYSAQTRNDIPFLSKIGIRPDGLIIYAGAHQGVIASVIAKLIVPEGRVLCLEIDPINAQTANENFLINGITNAVAYACALGDSVGLLPYSWQTGPVTRALGREFFPKIRSLSLDTLCRWAGVPDLIYMDVEGYEWPAIRCSDESLRCTPAWFVEMHGDGVLRRYRGSNNLIWERFSAAGYETWIARSEEGEFVRVRSSAEVPKSRCFLAALRCEEF